MRDLRAGSVKSQIRIKGIIILAAVLTFALGTVGVAYFMNWIRRPADFQEQSVLVNGVKITAKQSIVDSSYAYLAFEVKGYDLPQGAKPGFDCVDVTVDGQAVNMSASFYDTISAGEDKTLKYQISLALVYEDDTFINKPVHVVLKDLGVYAGKAMSAAADMECEWVFDWILQESNEIYKTKLNEKLEGTDVTVIGAEVSPISLKAIYHAPRVSITKQGVDEKGECFYYETCAEPPGLAGVKMKDGSFYPNLYKGPGRSGYKDEDSDTYVEMFAIDRILEVDQVEALLFHRGNTGNEEGAGMEDRYYIVNIR